MVKMPNILPFTLSSMNTRTGVAYKIEDRKKSIRYIDLGYDIDAYISKVRDLKFRSNDYYLKRIVRMLKQDGESCSYYDDDKYVTFAFNRVNSKCFMTTKEDKIPLKEYIFSDIVSVSHTLIEDDLDKAYDNVIKTIKNKKIKTGKQTQPEPNHLKKIDRGNGWGGVSGEGRQSNNALNG